MGKYDTMLGKCAALDYSKHNMSSNLFFIRFRAIFISVKTKTSLLVTNTPARHLLSHLR